MFRIFNHQRASVRAARSIWALTISLALQISPAQACQDEGTRIALKDFGRIDAVAYSVGTGGVPSLELRFEPADPRVAALNPSVKFEFRKNPSTDTWEVLRSVETPQGFSDPVALAITQQTPPLAVRSANDQAGGHTSCVVREGKNLLILTQDGRAGFGAGCAGATRSSASRLIRMSAHDVSSKERLVLQIATEITNRNISNIEGILDLIASIGGRSPAGATAKFSSIDLKQGPYIKSGCAVPRKVSPNEVIQATEPVSADGR